MSLSSMRPLVPIGPGCTGSVRPPQDRFILSEICFSGSLPGIAKMPRSGFHSKEQDEQLAEGQSGLSPLDLEYAPSGFGFDFRSAEMEYLGRILHRLTILVIEINRQKIEHMTELVQQSERLAGNAVSGVRPNVYQPRATDFGQSPVLRA